MKKYLLILSVVFCLNSQESYSQQFDWAINGYGPNAFMQIGDFAIDVNGNSYLTGTFSNDYDFDPGPGVFMLDPFLLGRIFVSKYNSAGDLVWVKGFRCSQLGISTRYRIALDDAGNIFFAGHFYDSLYADPGPGTVLHVNSDPEFDMFLIKLNSNGDYVWSATFPCNDGTLIEDLTTDAVGDIIMTGSFYGEVDFNPGPAQYLLTSSPIFSSWGFVVKLHTSGSLYFAFKTGGSSSSVRSVQVLPSGNFYIFGDFGSTIHDFDPGVGTFYLNSQNGSNFICRFTPQGAFSNGYQTDGLAIRTTFDSDYNIVMAGVAIGVSDMDPGPGVYSLNPNGTKVYVSKLDSLLNHQWSFNWGGNMLSSQSVAGLVCDADNNIFISGVFQGTTDTDPGIGTAALISGNSTPGHFLVEYDSTGNLNKNTQFSGSLSQLTFGMFLGSDGDNNIFTSGNYNTMFDANPGLGIHLLSSVGNGYAYFIKLEDDTCQNLEVKVDSLINPTCTMAGYASAQANNGTPGYQYSWNTNPPDNNPSLSIPGQGFYTVTVTDSAGCIASSTILAGGAQYPNQVDMKLTGISSNVVPGDTTYVTLNVTNNGCVPATGTLFFEIGPDVTFAGSNPAPDIILGDSLLWFINNIQYGDPALIYVVKLIGDTSLTSGDSICFYGTITTSPNDIDLANNSIALCNVLQTSNNAFVKKVFPSGICDARIVLKNLPLNYSIRFQNTGDTTAFNMRIIDTLDMALDINSLIVHASSHPMITEIHPGNVLHFRFDNINLPHSAANMQGSMGYVDYEITPDTTVPDMTIVRNDAVILFDFNLPETTNEVFNTLSTTLPLLPDTHVTVTGITLNAVPGYTSYQWVDCNTGLNVGSATSFSFTPTVNGSYYVLINDNGCEVTSGCHNIVSVGLPDENKTPSLQIYPNPAIEQFHITLPEHMYNAVIEVSDVLGKIIHSERGSSSSEIIIQSDNWTPGLYMIRVSSPGMLVSGRLLKISSK